MIGRLHGAVAEQESDGSCVLDVGGVGYEVFVPLRTLDRLTVGEALTLYVHTHVREDALALFGFTTREDRATFRALLGVASVGPKVALAILSRLDARSIALAIARNDKNAFRGISGVGKKTVERVLLDLRDKLPVPAAGAVTHKAVPAPAPNEPLSMVVTALVQLGYKQSEAEWAASQITSDVDGKPTETLLREALAALG